MKIKKSRNRIVLVFPCLGIVIKLPFIHFVSGINDFLWSIKDGHFRWRWNSNIESMESFKELLFKGILYNWREYLFFIKYRHPFTTPTYFSFFGFLNLQRLGQPCIIDSLVLWQKLIKLSNGTVAQDGHHFTNPENFCFINKKLRIIDYGSLRTQQVITKIGLKIMNDFVN